MLTGAAPFKRGDVVATMFAHLNDPMPANQALSPPVSAVLARALAKSPPDRFASCGEFAAALRSALTETGEPAAHSASSWPAPRPHTVAGAWRAGRRRRAGLIAAAALVLAAAGVGTALALPGAPKSAGRAESPAASTTADGFDAGLTAVVNPSSKRGGTLSFATPGTPDSLDPGNTHIPWVWDFSRLYATPLVTYKSAPGAAGDTLVPGIATSLGQVSPDGLTWTYHIKPGPRFSNGTPVTAADVKYAVERTYDQTVLPDGRGYFPVLLADPGYPGPYKAKNTDLTSVTTPDAHTIKFHLRQPFPDFNYVVAIPQTAPVPPASDTGASYQLHVVSTGPYMFQSYQPGQQATLVPNPYWTQAEDPQARQLASKVTITFNQDPDTVDSLLTSGRVDIDAAGSGVQETAQEQILSSGSLRAHADAAPSNVLWLAYLDTKVVPLNNLACRQAIEYAANKDDLQAAFGGADTGGVIASTLLLPGMPGYQPSDLYQATSQPTGDLADATRALIRCGHPHGFTIGAAYGNDQPKLVEAALRLQAALARVGITLQLHGYAGGNSYFTSVIGSPNYMQNSHLGVAFGNWEPDWPDGYSQLYQLLDSGNISPVANTDVSELDDSVIDGLFSQADGSSLSAAQRNAIYGRIAATAMSDAAIVPIVDGRNLLYRNPAVTNAYIEAPYATYNYAVLGVST